MFWRVDLKCTACDWTKRDHWDRRGAAYPACETCGAATERAWLMGSFPAIHGDEMDFTDHNMTSQPIRFTSKSERRRVMKQLGIQEKIRHVGVQGGDRSPHTTRWY
jgi:hypothetical protein